MAEVLTDEWTGVAGSSSAAGRDDSITAVSDDRSSGVGAASVSSGCGAGVGATVGDDHGVGVGATLAGDDCGTWWCWRRRRGAMVEGDDLGARTGATMIGGDLGTGLYY